MDKWKYTSWLEHGSFMANPQKRNLFSVFLFPYFIKLKIKKHLTDASYRNGDSQETETEMQIIHLKVLLTK